MWFVSFVNKIPLFVIRLVPDNITSDFELKQPLSLVPKYPLGYISNKEFFDGINSFVIITKCYANWLWFIISDGSAVEVQSRMEGVC